MHKKFVLGIIWKDHITAKQIQEQIKPQDAGETINSLKMVLVPLENNRWAVRQIE